MLLLVLILVLAAFGLLLVALVTGAASWAWASVAVSVVAAAALVFDWVQRRAAVSDGSRAAQPVGVGARSGAGIEPPTTAIHPVGAAPLSGRPEPATQAIRPPAAPPAPPSVAAWAAPGGSRGVDNQPHDTDAPSGSEGQPSSAAPTTDQQASDWSPKVTAGAPGAAGTAGEDPPSGDVPSSGEESKATGTDDSGTTDTGGSGTDRTGTDETGTDETRTDETRADRDESATAEGVSAEDVTVAGAAAAGAAAFKAGQPVVPGAGQPPAKPRDKSSVWKPGRSGETPAAAEAAEPAAAGTGDGARGARGEDAQGSPVQADQPTEVTPRMAATPPNGIARDTTVERQSTVQGSAAPENAGPGGGGEVGSGDEPTTRTAQSIADQPTTAIRLPGPPSNPLFSSVTPTPPRQPEPPAAGAPQQGPAGSGATIPPKDKAAARDQALAEDGGPVAEDRAAQDPARAEDRAAQDPTRAEERVADQVSDAATRAQEPVPADAEAATQAIGAIRPDNEPGQERPQPAAAAIVATLDDEVLVVDEQPRFHLAGCRALTGSETIPLPVKEAVEYEFTPCEMCSPVRVLAARKRASSPS